MKTEIQIFWRKYLANITALKLN